MLAGILIAVIVISLVGGPLLWKAYSKGGVLEGTDWKAKDRIQGRENRKAAEDRGYSGSDEVLVGNLILPEEVTA